MHLGTYQQTFHSSCPRCVCQQSPLVVLLVDIRQYLKELLLSINKLGISSQMTIKIKRKRLIKTIARYGWGKTHQLAAERLWQVLTSQLRWIQNH